MGIKRDNEAIAKLYTEQLLKEYDVRDDLSLHWCKDKDDPKVLHPKGDPDCVEDAEEYVSDAEWLDNLIETRDDIELAEEYATGQTKYIKELLVTVSGQRVGVDAWFSVRDDSLIKIKHDSYDDYDQLATHNRGPGTDFGPDGHALAEAFGRAIQHRKPEIIDELLASTDFNRG